MPLLGIRDLVPQGTWSSFSPNQVHFFVFDGIEELVSASGRYRKGQVPFGRTLNAMAWSAQRSGDSEELSSLLEKRARLEQSLKRSLTMVVWYRVCYSRYFFFCHSMIVTSLLHIRTAVNRFGSHTKSRHSRFSNFKTFQS